MLKLQILKAAELAQTVIYRILDALVRMLAPILAFTSEEDLAIYAAQSKG